jgi:uncharacterized delta-60 repeat protein
MITTRESLERLRRRIAVVTFAGSTSGRPQKDCAHDGSERDVHGQEATSPERPLPALPSAADRPCHYTQLLAETTIRTRWLGAPGRYKSSHPRGTIIGRASRWRAFEVALYGLLWLWLAQSTTADALTQTSTPIPPTPESTPTCPPSHFTPSPAREPGDLDTRFGSNGLTLTSFGSDDSSAAAGAVVIQPDAKIVAEGPAAPGGLYARFGLVRYNPDGSLDDAFGTKGVVTTVIGSSHAIPHAIVAQHDGRLVVAGETYGPFEFALARYNPDGGLDPSFGTSGIVNSVRRPWAAAHALILQPDGRLVAAGTSDAGFILRRYLPDGESDPSFGSDGEVTTSTVCSPDHSRYCSINALVLQPDGRIVAAGGAWRQEGMGGNVFVLARYETDGRLDQTFGTGGIVITPVTSEAIAIATVLQPNGKMVVGGYDEGGGDFALTRYNTDGSLDSGFGNGGIVLQPIGNLEALIIQPDGKLVGAGFSYYDPFVLARFNNDGSLDSSFGNNGTVLSQFPWLSCYGVTGEWGGLATDADQNIVVAGSLAFPGRMESFAVARYLGSLPPSGMTSTPTTIATPTATPTPTQRSTVTFSPTCFGPTPIVDAVLSPTGALVQTIRGSVHPVLCERLFEIVGVEVISQRVDCTHGFFEATIQLHADETNEFYVCQRGECATINCATVTIVQHSALAGCSGDCSRNGVVTVDELVTGVNIALGLQSLHVCGSYDTNGDGRIDIAEIIAAVRQALDGCPSPAATPTPMPTST